jgi:hypothetical protein
MPNHFAQASFTANGTTPRPARAHPAALFVAALVAPAAIAQPPTPAIAPWPTRFVPQAIDSGQLVPTALPPHPATPLFEALLHAPGSAWVRVNLAGTTLAEGATLVVVSSQDGARQTLSRDTLAQWAESSAYFNGPAVRIELHAPPGSTAPSRVVATGLWAEDFEQATPATICGTTDDRVPSFDNRLGRLSNGCTAWIINDLNGGYLTAGHCGLSAGSVLGFNIPPSTPSGGLQQPPPEDQYAVDAASNQGVSGGTGNDWRYFGVFPNPIHGQLPVQRYGGRFTLLPSAPAPAGQTIRITGYGTAPSFMPPERNQVQTTHTGPFVSLTSSTLRYAADTTGGNSGSPVILEASGFAVGIHTHGGCSSTGGANIGTAAQNAGFASALANPIGVLRTGRGTISGDLFALGDLQNNFGTVNPAPTNFARVAQLGAAWQGLAWHAPAQTFYAIDASRTLHRVSTSGVAVALGPVSGVAATLTGLGLDPAANAGQGALYAVDPAAGRLYRIALSTRVAVAVGPTHPGTALRALDFDTRRNTLWGIDTSNPGTAGARLVQINPATGTRSTIGPLGHGIVSCPDLAFVPTDATLRTINAATGELLAINPATGAATTLGPTGGVFGTVFGLASAAPTPAACAADFDNSGTLNPDDLADYIACYFTVPPCPRANQDGDEAVNPDDLADFIALFFAGCP